MTVCEELMTQATLIGLFKGIEVPITQSPLSQYTPPFILHVVISIAEVLATLIDKSMMNTRIKYMVFLLTISPHPLLVFLNMTDS